jgi:hypothetical protein
MHDIDRDIIGFTKWFIVVKTLLRMNEPPLVQRNKNVQMNSTKALVTLRWITIYNNIR